MRRRLTAVGAGVLVLVLAVVLYGITWLAVEGGSCGAFDSGPDTHAQKVFCDGPWSALVGLAPVVVLGAGAAIGVRRHSYVPIEYGAAAAAVAVAVTWALVP